MLRRRQTALPTAALVWVNQFAVPPEQPGGTRHYDIGSELSRRGWNVTLVASDLNLGTRSYGKRRGPEDHRAIEEADEHVRWVWLSAGAYTVNDWRRAASMLVFGGNVVNALWRRPLARESVVIGSSPHLFAALGAWLVAALRRRPFVFEVRDLWPESFVEVSGRSGGPDITVMRWIADFLYKRASAIVILAEGNRGLIAARGVDPDRIVFVPNGVDLATWGNAAVDVPWDQVGGESVFLYAGAHGPANGLDVAVDACRLLQERSRTDIRVVLMGDGPSKVELREQAERAGLRNVTFCDPVPKSQVGAVMAKAQVGLMLLADAELFRVGVSPNKLFDYMAAERPVLTNVPGLVSGLVADADCGVAVTPGDPRALADAMELMTDSPRTDWGGNGRAFVEQNFDRRQLADRLDRLLSSLVQRT